MAEQLYQLYCELCNWKKITNGSPDDVQDLIEVKTVPVQKTIPKYGQEVDTTLTRGYKSQEIVPAKEMKRKRRFKCPKCGRLVLPVKITNPQAKLKERQEQERQQERMKAAELEAEQRMVEQISKKEKERENIHNAKKDQPDGSKAGS